MNIDRILLCCLATVVLVLLWQKCRTRLLRWWQRTKDHLPRTWKPKSPGDCAGCQAGISLVPLPDPSAVTPWTQVKSKRGRHKTVDTAGLACPNPEIVPITA